MPHRFLRLAFLGLLAQMCLPALADSTPHWLEVKTDHFTVLSDAGDRQTRQVASQFERMQALFAKLLPHAGEDTGSQIVVLAVKNRKDFQTIEPAAYLAKNSLDLAGLFMQRQDRSYILLRLDTEGEHPYSTVYHEYTHYMNRHDETLPIWLNEGLAEFFQNTDLDERGARLGQPSASDLEFLREQRLLPLATLFAVDHNSPYYHEENKGNIFYAESWALTHMLFIRDFQNHTNELRDYVLDVAKGESNVVAAQHAFGDLKRLETDLAAYVNGSRFSQFTMPLQNTIKEASLTVEPVSPPDADAIRADVLMENGRKDEAKALINSVLSKAPENAQVHESMGLLELREGNLLEARKWYGEAVALHSTSYLSYYYFGSLSMQFGHAHPDDPTDETVGAALHEAVKLNPKFAPADAALAHFDAGHEQLDEAAQMMLQAIVLDPSNIGYRMEASEIRVQRKDFISAVSILKGAEKIAHTPEDRERVQARLDSLERYQAQLAAAKEQAPQGEATVMETVNLSAESSHGAANNPEVRAVDGTVLHPIVPSGGEHNFPAGPATGPRRTVKGVLHSVACYYPKGLMLDVDGNGKQPLPLYSNDMYGIKFTASNFTPKKDLNPCKEFEGMKASVVYAEVDDKAVAGQIVSIELSR